MAPYASPTPARPGEPIPTDLALAALRGFFQITGHWGLSEREQMTILGQPPRSTFFAWKAGNRAILQQETLARINCVLGIWKALRLDLPDVNQAIAWVRRPNDSPLFEGASPLAFMARGRAADLADVRRFLDARLGVR